jgi:phenylacetate-CoA ligase
VIEALADLIAAIRPTNRFHAHKLRDLNLADLATPADIRRLPFTTKAELVADQIHNPPYGSNHTEPLERYTRFHQTSGTTTGQPLVWLDTPASWESLLGIWKEIYATLGLTANDTLFFPFSFGPFLGFWSGFEGAARIGHRVLSGGGMSSIGRLRFLLKHGVTIVFATPTYAVHLVEVAEREGIDLKASAVRMIVVAGEPGGNIPATRARIEAGWGAKVIDHYGLTETGPVALELPDQPGGLAIIPGACIAEVIDPATLEPAETGELVLTTLARRACPVIRYRTGDLVRRGSGLPTMTRLEGGILGRADEMVQVRGNNVYPSAVEAIVRRFPDVAEYRATVDCTGPLAGLRLEIETSEPGVAPALARAIHDALLFRADVTVLPPGTLPRYEMKAKRWIIQR